MSPVGTVATPVPVAGGWDALADALTSLATAPGRPTLLLLELDLFRQMLEVHGRAGVTAVAASAAQRVRDVLAGDEQLLVLGGGRFAVVGRASEEADVTTLAERVGRSLTRPLLLGGVTLHISGCIGAGRAQGGDVDGLIAYTEVALARARAIGRGRTVVVDDELRKAVARRADVEAQLLGAQSRGELYLVFQPIRDLLSKTVVGAEALLRWEHPRLGLVSPVDFLDIAEDAGLMDAIGMFVLQESLRVCAMWREDIYVSVNVSALQLRTRGFATMVKVALLRSGLPASRLRLELTESILIADDDVPMAELAGLRELGVSVGIDDFGTGYATMAYLKMLPVDFIKVDRQFVWGLPSSAIDTAIVTSTLAMADALGVETIVEGVETEDQHDALIELGATHAQGYLFARPVRSEDLTL